jgi:N-acetylmuramoyl-L-alanine amidase
MAHQPRIRSRRRPWTVALLCALTAALTLPVAPGHAAPGGLTGKVICIDPGHPSEKGSGAQGPGGYRELTANWQVALKLKALLQQAGAKVVLTKQSEKQSVRNRRRAEIANQAHAALMIRLHCDSGKGSGFAVYYPDRQGKAEGRTGPSSSVITASRKAAQAIAAGMKRSLTGSLASRGVKGDSATAVGGSQGALTGSVFSQVPVVTVEMVMLTNPRDERFIRSDAGQKKLAAALKAGIAGYLK